MKKTILSLCLIFLGIIFKPLYAGKEPTVVEIETMFKTVKEATLATKKSLMSHKFIPNGAVTDNGFTATRTTGSKADYYTADVMTEDKGGKIVVTITFIKSGTGLLKLQKLGEEIKAELGGSNTSSGMQKTVTSGSTQQVAQNNLSQDELQARCTKFTKMKKGGIAMIIGGGILAGGGLILQSINTSTNGVYELGSIMTPIGTLALGGGIALTIIAGKKVKQYCALNLKVSVHSIGLAYVF